MFEIIATTGYILSFIVFLIMWFLYPKKRIYTFVITILILLASVVPVALLSIKFNNVYTEIRSYEIINYGNKDNKLVVFVKDVDTNTMLSLKSCVTKGYFIGDIVRFRTAVKYYEDKTDLRLLTQHIC